MNLSLRNSVLASLIDLIDANRVDILAANAKDLAACPPDNQVIIDRLKVNEEKVDAMTASLKDVIGTPDPLGRILYETKRDDGLKIENRTVPFGTILIIYEARPDVSIEAAAIALKAGNRILLKGGKEARETNILLTELWQQALSGNDADRSFVRYLDLSREETQRLISDETEKFDLVIPRGGDRLIDFVLKNSAAPVMVSGRGNNFLFVHSDADREMAIRIVVNGKQRLSVCNALDKILIDSSLSDLAAFTTDLVSALIEAKIEVYGDEEVRNVTSDAIPIPAEEIWYEEFLDAKIVIGIVDGTDVAIEAINKYSGGHSASIVTRDGPTATTFMEQVDCAAVYHNASTRFTDGGQFGLGAEIAISTQKLHARGPLGAEHLVTNKWFVYGDGQTRS